MEINCQFQISYIVLLSKGIDIKRIFGIKETSISESSLWLFFALFGSILFSASVFMMTDEKLVLGLPAVLLLIYQSIVDYRKVFFLLLFTIPLSVEFYLGGFGTDLPTEPLVIGLMLSYGLHLLTQWKDVDMSFVKHPISMFLLVHLLWIILATWFSELFLVSLKFLLAKIWYIAGYFFLAASVIKTEKDVKKFFWIIFTPLFIATVFTLIRHSAYGFSFADVKYVMKPFFRNHVLYAAILAVFIPITFLSTTWYKSRSLIKWGLIAACFILLAATYLSYTRTAYLALIIGVGSYFIFRFKLVKLVSLASFVMIIAACFYIVNDNKYLDYAPEFDKTITHYEFEDLVSATAKGQDVSTMERVYRWVAGMQMSKKEWLTGHGPGNFYNFYQNYSVTSFYTYVSDNPDKSGIHCYYLMVLVDQGIPGAIIFLLFTFFILIKGEKIYHESKTSERKNIVMMLLISLVVIDAFQLVNDMLETDKVGAFYFMFIAILINMDKLNKKDELLELSKIKEKTKNA
ncbi:MAG: O-antigen ligase family protein [Saprospiraceae bacterium]